MKIAVVTGASSGMGREFVRQISALYPGLDEIWVFARRQERMERLRDRCHTPLRIFAGNLLKKKICKEYGKALEDSRDVYKRQVMILYGLTALNLKSLMKDPAIIVPRTDLLRNDSHT